MWYFNIIVKDKSEFNIIETRNVINKWLKKVHTFDGYKFQL